MRCVTAVAGCRDGVGWESFIVLIDVRGLSADAARKLTLRTALTLLDAAAFKQG